VGAQLEEKIMRKLLEVGGLIAGVVLVAFGIGAIALSLGGRSTIHDNLAFEGITGSPDMTPALITKEAKESKLDLSKTPIPTCSVANKAIDSGSRAHCFAQYMRIHALEATGGQTYAQMGRFLTADGKSTNDSAAAAVDPKTQKPVENGLRNLWVTETALTSALNLSYTAQQIALFGLVVGIALLLTGIGFLVLALGGALESERLFWAIKPKQAKSSPVVPA
jgi:hypothetical protein